jgi:hypothetical protein
MSISPTASSTTSNSTSLPPPTVNDNTAAQTSPITGQPMGPPAPPTPDDEAKALIQNHQGESCSLSLPMVGGINCKPDTDGVAVGRDIANIAKTEPARARAVYDKALTQSPNVAERQEIAQGLAQELKSAELTTLAGTANGRQMLDSARTELRVEGGSDAGKAQAQRIDSAIKSADFQKTPEFKNLDAATQQKVTNQIVQQEQSTAAVDNTIALARSAGFQSASPATRSELLAAQAKRAEDPIFREGLEKLAADPAFQKLNPAQQANAITSFTEFAGREAYQGKEGSWFFNLGATSVSDADKRLVLDNARSVVTSAGFNDVAADSQKAMLDALAQNATNTTFTGNLVGLVNDSGFISLNNAAKEQALLKQYGQDRDFATGVNTLRATPAFTALTGAERASTLNDVTRLSQSKSYKDASAADRSLMVEVVGDLAGFSAANPSNTITRNTLDRLLDGDIKLSLYQQAPAGGFVTWGTADSNGINLNVDPAVRALAAPGRQYVDTLAHEVNHFVNGTTSAGTADRFLDEYRAALTGIEARTGRPPTIAEQRATLDNLTDGTNPSYGHLGNLYTNDATFKGAVDGLYSSLNGSGNPANPASWIAPTSVTPEQARAALLGAGITSTYLNTAGNLDNHK